MIYIVLGRNGPNLGEIVTVWPQQSESTCKNITSMIGKQLYYETNWKIGIKSANLALLSPPIPTALMSPSQWMGSFNGLHNGS